VSMSGFPERKRSHLVCGECAELLMNLAEERSHPSRFNGLPLMKLMVLLSLLMSKLGISSYRRVIQVSTMTKLHIAIGKSRNGIILWKERKASTW